MRLKAAAAICPIARGTRDGADCGRMNPSKLLFPALATIALTLARPSPLLAQPATPIPEVLARIDPAAGTPKEQGREFTIHGVVGARLIL